MFAKNIFYYTKEGEKNLHPYKNLHQISVSHPYFLNKTHSWVVSIHHCFNSVQLGQTKWPNCMLPSATRVISQVLQQEKCLRYPPDCGAVSLNLQIVWALPPSINRMIANAWYLGKIVAKQSSIYFNDFYDLFLTLNTNIMLRTHSKQHRSQVSHICDIRPSKLCS